MKSTPNMSQIKTVLSYFLAASFALSSFAIAQDTVAPADNHPRAVLMMSKSDTNGDSQISLPEFLARARSEEEKSKINRGFKMFDADGNGFVTYAELNSRFARINLK